MKRSEVQSLVKRALQMRIGSGLAADFGKLDDLFSGQTPNEIFAGQVSHLNEASAITSETFFDLASLTKIIATTTLAMAKVESGALDLSSKLNELLPEQVARNASLEKITVAQLLSHTSGLPAWKPFYELMQMRFGAKLPYASIVERERYFESLLFAVEREAEPLQKVVYSDLGFLILEKILSPTFEKSIREVWSQIPNSKLHFRLVDEDAVSARTNLVSEKISIAATEVCPWRGLVQGQVHDDNTWSKGGIAGHAGAFGRLSDVQAWIKTVFSGKLVSYQTLRTFAEEVSPPSSARRALGFDMPPSDGAGSTGNAFSMNSVGHLGFTGTSLWVDLDSGHYAILLTNRVHPSRVDIRVRALRREFHALVRS